jgi:hypothetical protein
MVMTIEPQVEAVQDAGVTGALGDGVGADVDDIPPPQALNAAISTAAGNIARGERCI